MTPDNDRWFRMCIEASKYLDLSSCKKGFCGHTTDADLFDGVFYKEPTVDELMETYTGIYGVNRIHNADKYYILLMLIDTRASDNYYTYCWTERYKIEGESDRDCWLQLVMWDKMSMVWDDGQSRWCKV
jgi:hypothetical protein